MATKATKSKATSKKKPQKVVAKTRKKPGPQKGYKKKAQPEAALTDEAVVDGAGYSPIDMTSAAADGYRDNEKAQAPQETMPLSLQRAVESLFASQDWLEMHALSFDRLTYAGRVAVMLKLEEHGYISSFSNDPHSCGLTYDFCTRGLQYIKGIRFNHVNKIVKAYDSLAEREPYYLALDVEFNLHLRTSEKLFKRPETLVVDGETYVRVADKG